MIYSCFDIPVRAFRFPPTTMQLTAQNLLDTVTLNAPLLRQISPEQAMQRPAPGKWSAKEIIGHLIDSAANNHQRFVRIQEGVRDLRPYRYAQEHWVLSQHYQKADWHELLLLWEAYNRHLARIIRHIPLALAGAELHTSADAPPITVQFLVEDYLAHLRHHVAQIIDIQNVN